MILILNDFCDFLCNLVVQFSFREILIAGFVLTLIFKIIGDMIFDLGGI